MAEQLSEDEKNQKRAEIKIQENLELIRDYKKVFNSISGRKVLFDLMKKGHFLMPTFSADGQEASWRNEGQRELILHIISTLDKDVQQTYELIKQQTGSSREYFL